MENLGEKEIKDFLAGLPARLDFELGLRTNPLDENGDVSQGRYQVAGVFLKYGKYKRTKITDLVLNELNENEKPLSAKQEDPIEQAMRNFAKNLSVTETQPPEKPPTPTVTPAVTPPPTPPTKLFPPPGAPNFMDYIIFIGSPNIFERTTGRYISASEAGNIPNFWARVISAGAPRPEIKTETDFALWESKNLTNFPV